MSPGRLGVGSTMLVLCALCVATALAQAPAQTTGNYGGGRLKTTSALTFVKGAMLVELRSAPDGRVRINVALFLSRSCPYDALFSARAMVAADGSFSITGASNERYTRGTLKTRYALSGTLSGGSATGRASARVAIYRGARRIGSCAKVTVGWSARRPTGALGPPGAVPGATLMGTTSQRSDGPRHAIIMQISQDARKLRRAAYGVSSRCGRHVDAFYDSARPNITISGDGTFADVTHSTTRYPDVRVVDTDRLSGQIGATGATGTLSTAERTISRRTGRTVRRCASGTVHWTASP